MEGDGDQTQTGLPLEGQTPGVGAGSAANTQGGGGGNADVVGSFSVQELTELVTAQIQLAKDQIARSCQEEVLRSIKSEDYTDIPDELVVQNGRIFPLGSTEERALKFPLHYPQTLIRRPIRQARGWQPLDSTQDPAANGFREANNAAAVLEFSLIRAYESYVSDLGLASLNPKLTDGEFREQATNALSWLFNSLRKRRQVLEVEGRAKMSKNKRERERANVLKRDYSNSILRVIEDLDPEIEATEREFRAEERKQDLKDLAKRASSGQGP